MVCLQSRASAQAKDGIIPASTIKEQLTATSPATPARPRGRAAVLLWGPDGVAGYRPEIAPGPGQSLRVLADATVPASILIAAFEKSTRKLPQGLKPVFVARENAFDEAGFPGDGAAWKFEKKAEAVEVYVVVFQPGDAGATEAGKLVQGIARGDPGAAETRRVKALHQMIQDWLRGREPWEFQARYRPPGKAAVTRSIGSGVGWQKHLSTSAAIKEGAPGILLFTVGD